jgi:hypothetical protein
MEEEALSVVMAHTFRSGSYTAARPERSRQEETVGEVLDPVGH